MDKSKPEVMLNEWSIFDGTLLGKAYGHPRFENGTEVRTSSVLHRFGTEKVETRNTIYILGHPAGDQMIGYLKEWVGEPTVESK